MSSINTTLQSYGKGGGGLHCSCKEEKRREEEGADKERGKGEEPLVGELLRQFSSPSVPNLDYPQYNLIKSHHWRSPSWSEKLRKITGRSCEMQSSSHLSDVRPANPSCHRSHRNLRWILLIVGNRTQPKSTGLEPQIPLKKPPAGVKQPSFQPLSGQHKLSPA